MVIPFNNDFKYKWNNSPINRQSGSMDKKQKQKTKTQLYAACRRFALALRTHRQKVKGLRKSLK